MYTWVEFFVQSYEFLSISNETFTVTNLEIPSRSLSFFLICNNHLKILSWYCKTPYACCFMACLVLFFNSFATFFSIWDHWNICGKGEYLLNDGLDISKVASVLFKRIIIETLAIYDLITVILNLKMNEKEKALLKFLLVLLLVEELEGN